MALTRRAALALDNALLHEAVRGALARLEQAVAGDAVLASNTSSLSIASIAGACRRPERVVGVHFFNPAPVLKLIEVVRTLEAGGTTLEESLALWERGEELATLCQHWLDRARERLAAAAPADDQG